nr:hypothetical protein [Tanacetum cinerariifolium]
MWLIVVSDKEETMDLENLFTKYPIVDWESQNLGNVDMEVLHVYKIIRANGNISYHKSLSSMLRKFDRQDLVDLHRLVMKRFEGNTLEGNLSQWKAWIKSLDISFVVVKIKVAYSSLLDEDKKGQKHHPWNTTQLRHKNTSPAVEETPNTYGLVRNTINREEGTQWESSSNSVTFSSFINLLKKQVSKFYMIMKTVSEIKDAFGNKQYKPEDVQELIRKLFNDVQNIHEELAEYINTPSWNRLAFYNYNDNDDEDYTIAITPVLSIEEPVDSLIMEDEHLDTISATKSDEVIKSSVEDLVPILSESKGILDNMCDVPFRDNSSPLNILKDQFEDFSDSNDDSTSIDDDYFSIDDIDYVEASPPDSELVSLEEVKDDILREKLLNIHILIDKIESLNDNPTPDRVLKSPSIFPIPVKDKTSSGSTTTHADNFLPDYDSFLFEIEPEQGELTSIVMEDILGEPRVHVPNVLPTHSTLYLDLNFIHSDNSLLGSEIFWFDIEEKNSGSTTIHADISLPDLDHFRFKIEPDPGELTSIVDSKIRENVLSATNVNLSPEDDQSPLFAYVVWILFPILKYLVAPPYLLSSGNEDTIFNPGISIYHSLLLGVSHQSRTFMKFNVYPNHLNESPMKILSSTCFPIDQ